MSQTETGKAVAAEERKRRPGPSFEESERPPGASTQPRRRSASCWRGSAGRLPSTSYVGRRGSSPTPTMHGPKEFIEAGKERLTRETVRDATGQEIQQLRRDNYELKQLVAELSLEGHRLKTNGHTDDPTPPPAPTDEG